jgi:hypothetical protein
LVQKAAGRRSSTGFAGGRSTFHHRDTGDRKQANQEKKKNQINKHMDNKPKTRLGNGKKRNDSWITASLCLSDAEAHAYTYNGKKYVNLNVNIYDKPNEYGKDVAISLNEYKKDEGAKPQVNKMPATPATPYQAEDYDLPF